ncbi:MAG TPA: MotA/TolQ/ExbB proton channel family protein [Verrucomicrobiae bacterium]|jgi:biopolymer transport protein ExbB|nr:MotA/TolQ/ExbB proton channel family protein [Verrucomicrobiae bacterium]
MLEFLKAGGPVMFLLALTSIVGLTFIIERGFGLRWRRVIPADVEHAVEHCHSAKDAPLVISACKMNPAPISRLLLLGNEHLEWPKTENIDSIETAARHEVIQLERGIVVLEIIIGIAPLMGLVGTLHGLITLFASLGAVGISDNAALAKGISIALNTTLMGLIVAIPSLIAWSYYNKKVETLAVEMEALCERFLRSQYRESKVAA